MWTVTPRLAFMQFWYARSYEVSRSDAPMESAIGKLFKENISVEMTRRVGSKRCGRKVTIRTPPSPTTLRKWLRIYEGLGCDPLSLMDGFGRSGNRTTRLPDDLYGNRAGGIDGVEIRLRGCSASGSVFA